LITDTMTHSSPKIPSFIVSSKACQNKGKK